MMMSYNLFNSGVFYIQTEPDAGVATEATDWFKTTEFKNNLVVYLYPYIVYKLKRDPFNNTSVREIWGLEKDDPSKYLPEGAILFWDSHFGPNEGMLPFEKIINCGKFELLKTFKPPVPVTYLGREFEINVFKKNSSLSITPQKMEMIRYYENRIRMDSVWLAATRQKASEKNLELDSMIYLDALWMAESESNGKK